MQINKIVVISTDSEYCKALEDFLGTFVKAGNIPEGVVLVQNGRLDDLIFSLAGDPAKSFDYIITPGNSYGIMSGGFDGAVLEMFPTVEASVRYMIDRHFLGELPVGAALSVDAKSQFVHRVIYAPTMRIPMELPPETDVPYASTLAAFGCVHRGNHDHDPELSFIMTGHGVGTGGVAPDDVAWQQLMAISQAIRPKVFNRDDLFKAAKTNHGTILRRL